jgi:hypothetical protein
MAVAGRAASGAGDVSAVPVTWAGLVFTLLAGAAGIDT